VRIFIAFVLTIAAVCANAQLTIEITEGVDNPTPIAVVPFAGTAGLDEDMREIVAADLRRSGLFRPIPVQDMLSFPENESELHYRDWRVLGSAYVVIGSYSSDASGARLRYELYDVYSQKRLLSRTVSGSNRSMRDMAHAVSDAVYEAITGIRGIFSTKIIYVEDSGQAGPDRYRLMMADADGARPQRLFSSSQPLLSPSWSNDMTQVAYVSFETTRPAIFRQNLVTGEREQLTDFQGLNGAPAWSPDDQKIAMVLSKDGNPEIYVMDLATKRMTRVTNHFAIDTEPSWTADGKSIIFTSNRGASPQIYQVGLASGRVERLTFEGDYNARARVTPDGKSLVMIHRQNGVFHIAMQDIASGRLRILTETRLDESPSVAPNGAMLIYATQHDNKGVLAVVSMDAGVKFRLPSQQGDVREPAWSPFVN
jgi:TolB protein